MIRIFDNVNIDWLGKRRVLLSISIFLMLAGLASAIGRELIPGGTGAFNLGVDFRGGTVVTVNFKQRPTDDAIRAALAKSGIGDAVLQPVLDKKDQVLIKVARQEAGEEDQSQAQVDAGRTKVAEALATLGTDTGAEIVGTEAVGAVAGRQLRNQAITVTLLALVGILLYIAFRFEWTYGASAVITVFHDVLVTLGFFSIFQWEVSLTVIAALLTLVGFSVNDTIVTFDRVRENLRLRRRASLYDITNEAINQTLSRTIITAGLVFLSVLALVIFGGEVLRGFSLALLIGIVFGTYSTIAISNPIMVWWQQRLEPSRSQGTPAAKDGGDVRRRTQTVARNTKASAATR
ncbi:MAG TPA: protein translocase subunit SecF [Pyrinomonadaceae bacterium]|jgi:preprotein translocase subunit SecF